MKKYLQKELQVRLDDYRNNNPKRKPTTLLVHPITANWFEKKVQGLQVRTCVDMDIKEIVIF